MYILAFWAVRNDGVVLNPRLLARPNSCESILMKKATVLEMATSGIALSKVHVNVPVSVKLFVNAVARVDSNEAMLYTQSATTSVYVFQLSVTDSVLWN